MFIVASKTCSLFYFILKHVVSFTLHFQYGSMTLFICHKSWHIIVYLPKLSWKGL